MRIRCCDRELIVKFLELYIFSSCCICSHHCAFQPNMTVSYIYPCSYVFQLAIPSSSEHAVTLRWYCTLNWGWYGDTETHSLLDRYRILLYMTETYNDPDFLQSYILLTYQAKKKPLLQTAHIFDSYPVKFVTRKQYTCFLKFQCHLIRKINSLHT